MHTSNKQSRTLLLLALLLVLLQNILNREKREGREKDVEAAVAFKLPPLRVQRLPFPSLWGLPQGLLALPLG
jgi:hypothetical protein